MASRSNDLTKDTALKVGYYGNTPGFQAPTTSNVGRPVAGPNLSGIRAGMAADRGAIPRPRIPMSVSPMGVTRPRPRIPMSVSMPLASPGDPPTGIGGAARERKIMGMVDKL